MITFCNIEAGFSMNVCIRIHTCGWAVFSNHSMVCPLLSAVQSFH